MPSTIRRWLMKSFWQRSESKQRKVPVCRRHVVALKRVLCLLLRSPLRKKELRSARECDIPWGPNPWIEEGLACGLDCIRA